MRQTGDMDGPQNVLALPQTPDAIELRHLRAFVAVAEDLSFSRAAQRLFITQPALSRQIRGLERLVGCDLFRRSTQRVELTLAGEALLARARALLADLDDAISVTRSVGGELAGRMALLWEPWARASADVADLDGIRAALEELHGKFTPPPDVTVAPVIAGGVPALRITPEAASPAAVLYLHGGGHVAGSAFGYRHLAGAIATAARAPALVIDYRLAPEHPYPAAVQDAVNAYLWLHDTGGDEGKIVVAGDSSAGGLVMSLLLARARALLADLDDAISVTRSVGGELAGRMAMLWEPWARASADVADLDGIRSALEELHGKFTLPADLAVAPVIAGGVPALRITPEAAWISSGGRPARGVCSGLSSGSSAGWPAR